MSGVLEFRTGQYYRTRAGNKAAVLATGAPGPYPLVGYIEVMGGRVCPAMWTATGGFLVGDEAGSSDLVAGWRDPPKRVTKTVWIRIWADGSVGACYGPVDDAFRSPDNVIASRRVTLTFTEGEYED